MLSILLAIKWTNLFDWLGGVLIEQILNRPPNHARFIRHHYLPTAFSCCHCFVKDNLIIKTKETNKTMQKKWTTIEQTHWIYCLNWEKIHLYINSTWIEPFKTMYVSDGKWHNRKNNIPNNRIENYLNHLMVATLSLFHHHMQTNTHTHTFNLASARLHFSTHTHTLGMHDYIHTHSLKRMCV